MTGKIVLSMNVDGPPAHDLIREVIDTLAHFRNAAIEDGAGFPNDPHGRILDGNGNVRATWKYERD